jgi:hypothetical protein
MAAIITTPFRVLNAENFKEDVASSSVYLGIGKSDVWSLATSDTTDTIPFTPGDHVDDINGAWSQMIAMKKVTSSDVAHVVPRHDYADGESYVAWDSKDSDIYDDKFYVLTSEFKVYKCIQKGPSSTSVQPTHTTATIPVAGADGYRWKYMYTITTSDSEKFLTKSFMPVKTLAEAPVLADTNVNYPQQQSQINSRALATAAGIERIVIENGGSNYDAADVFTITIEGDGTAAAAVDGGVTVVGGAVTAIALSNVGTDYTKAKVTVTANNASGGAVGSGCIARAVISPPAGHGTDPVSELGAFFSALNVQLDGNDGSDFTVGNDFRQISIVKNPYASGTTVASDPTVRATKGLQLGSGQNTTGFVVDQVIQAASGGSGAKAYLVEIDATNARLYYYQNEKTGFTPFANNDTIQGTLPSGGSATLASSHNIAAEVVPGSGQLIFLENRDPISRSATQIEDIKCIIEF